MCFTLFLLHGQLSQWTLTCVLRPDGEGAYQGCTLSVVGFSVLAKMQLFSAVVKSVTDSA